MIRLALAEDNSAALRALKEKLSAYPDLTIRYEVSNGEELLTMFSADSGIDIILMDIEMPVMDGITATRIIKERYPEVKVVMVTIYDNDQSIFDAIQSGADSYILKETKSEKIYETINDTLNGGAVMSPSIAVKALRVLKQNNPGIKVREKNSGELTVRETEILECLSEGLTNKRIAEKLSISPFTVKRHIENIYVKLQAMSRVELVEKGKRKGLI